MIFIFLNLLRLKICLSQKMSHLCLRRMCVLLLGRVFCIYQIWLVYCVKSSISSLIFCLVGLHTIVHGILTFPTIIIVLSISPFNFVGFFFFPICSMQKFLGQGSDLHHSCKLQQHKSPKLQQHQSPNLLRHIETSIFVSFCFIYFDGL